MDITVQYSPYIYQYNAEATDIDAVATFSVQCDQSAYVALDNVRVTSAGRTANVLPTATTVTQYITQTQTQQQSRVLTQTQTTREVSTPAAQTLRLTNTISTILWSTVTHTIAETQTWNLTVSDVFTTTSEFLFRL